MSTGMGILSKAAFKKDTKQSTYPKTDWGANDITAGDQIPFLSESIGADVEQLPNDTIQGAAGRLEADTISKSTGGGLTVQGKYNNVGRLIACAMGFENPNDSGATYHGSPEADGSQYTHVLELDDNLHREGWLAGEERYPSGGGGGTWAAGDLKVRSGVVGIAKAVTDWRHYSCMVNRWTFRATPEGVSHEFDVIGYSTARSSYNSANWTLATSTINLIFPDATFSISGTEYGFSRFEMVLDNKLVAERDTKSGLYIIEPARSAKRDITFGFDFLRYDSDSRLDDLMADTERYCSLEFASGNYEFGIFFSAFKFAKIEAPVAGSDIIRMAHQCIPYIPSSDQYSSEWGNISLIKNKEMVVKIVDDNSSNYFNEN